MNADVIAASVARSAARDARREPRPHDPDAVLCPNAPFCPECWNEQLDLLTAKPGPERTRRRSNLRQGATR